MKKIQEIHFVKHLFIDWWNEDFARLHICSFSETWLDINQILSLKLETNFVLTWLDLAYNKKLIIKSQPIINLITIQKKDGSLINS